MKKKTVYIVSIALILVLALVFILISCFKSTSINIKPNQIDNIEISCGINKKIIKNSNEINKIIDYLNSLKVKNRKGEDIEGFHYKLNINYKDMSKHTIVITSNKVYFDTLDYLIIDDNIDLDQFDRFFN